MSNSGSGGRASGFDEIPPDFRWGEGNQEMYPWDADRPPNPSEQS